MMDVSLISSTFALRFFFEKILGRFVSVVDNFWINIVI
jgi:hypothetical protein